jgi:hypothetical protein
MTSGPTVEESYAYAWRMLWQRFPELLIVALMWMVVTVPAAVLHHSDARIASHLYHFLVVVPLDFGGLYVYWLAARGEPIRPADLFQAFRTAYVQTLLAHILFVVLVGGGLVLLVVPGLWIAARLSFVGFLVMGERLDAIEAVSESWRRTQGLAGRIWLFWLCVLPIALAGLLAFGVGIVPAMMWLHLAFAAFFVGVSAGAMPRAPEAQPTLAEA